MARAQLRWSEQALPAEHICKFYPSDDMFGICFCICYLDLSYSQSGITPMFSGPAWCPEIGLEQLNFDEA
jgi:hypothetical protein